VTVNPEALQQIVSNEKTRGMMVDMADRASRMRPMPPWDDLAAETWGKVDKLILKGLTTLREREAPRPLENLAVSFVQWSFEDLDKGVQTVAWRLMETYSLVTVFNTILKVVRDEGRDITKSIEIPFWVVLPDETKARISNGYEREVLSEVRADLMQRGIVKKPRGE
jgi:hypothetical protein